jgi:hypothetical protein
MQVAGFSTKNEGIAVMKDSTTGGMRTCFIVFNATNSFSLIQTYSYHNSYTPGSLTTYESGTTFLVFFQGNYGDTNLLSKVSFNITNMSSLHSQLHHL